MKDNLTETLEKPAAYYDEIYNKYPKYNKRWNAEQPTARLFEVCASLITPGSKVYDMGCGPGLFAQCLQETHHVYGYIGIDFSGVAIEKACKRFGAENQKYQFVQKDLRKVEPITLDRHATIICMETLEHIENDLGVIALWPSGAEAIISLPTFKDASHIRIFEQDTDIIERYKDYFDFRDVVFHTVTEPHDGRIWWRAFKTRVL